MQQQQFGFRFDNKYTTLPQSFFTKVQLNRVKKPSIAIFNRSLAQELQLNADELLQSGAKILAGNLELEGAAQIAQAYAGHQFGHLNMLGDGRALLLGEHVLANGDRFDVQLKGSGRTPYSRGGDGRAALGPMMREFIISEAMHALGIPTTRSLAVTSTGDVIYREQALEGAVLTRIAQSHLRVGTFQYAATFAGIENLRALADYAIARHYPEILQDENRYLALLECVLDKQAALVAKWQSVGFIHGVMNTDNMTISGETIDYGPCAFMDTFDPATVFSSIDTQGRYAYGNQPNIALWNLTRFAESLLPIIATDLEEAIQLAQPVVERFPSAFEGYYFSEMREKLGLLSTNEQDEALILQLLEYMERFEVDYTNTFRALTEGVYPKNLLFQSEEFLQWEQQWPARLDAQGTTIEEARDIMKTVNPVIIPRNHVVEQAINEFVEGEPALFLQLLQAVTNPYTTADSKFTEPPQDDSPPFVSYCGT
ncbi:YdiU family protein [Solibacillus sp. MA9]|uniref:Protein nucleotidyltransferase YdiU n=1 Tax=Solibacillus palustris TaxID=2908203 RepID=A0ABS9UD50_9BACL|nr:YdiU family protein [Solibacillus sp. MA9]MCH7322271.1 YdiU family protein [Solibacillus sp. MA9]